MNSNNGSKQEKIDITKDMVDYLDRYGEKMIARRRDLLESGALSEKEESGKMRNLLDGVEKEWNNLVEDSRKRSGKKSEDTVFEKGSVKINGENMEYYRKGIWRIKYEKGLIAIKPLESANETRMNLRYNLLLEVKNDYNLTVLHVDNMHVWLQEYEDGHRITALDNTWDEKKGTPFKEIDVKGNTQETIGDLELKSEDDGKTLVIESEGKKAILRNFGQERRMEIKYDDGISNFKINIDSINNSRKEEDAEWRKINLKENLV